MKLHFPGSLADRVLDVNSVPPIDALGRTWKALYFLSINSLLKFKIIDLPRASISEARKENVVKQQK